MLRKGLAAALAAALLTAGCASEVHVKMKLPMRPRLPLKGNERVAIAPFLLVSEAEKEKDKTDLSKVDVQAEFHRFLKKQLEARRKFGHRSRPSVTLPTRSLVELSRATEFWRGVGTQTAADLIVSGSLEFRVEDQAGYKTEEYVSPIDGQTYYRQIYVEQSGFVFDIVFLVLDGRTGEKLLQDEFKDFRRPAASRVDELSGLFENLFSLENQILNIFVPRDRDAERYIFTR